MMTLTIELTHEVEEEFKKLAARKGVSVEVLAKAVLQQSLEKSGVDIDELISEIVRENHELYKRLA